MDENPNRLLKDHPDFKDDFKSLNEYDKAKYMWIFVMNTNDIQPVQLKIQELISSNMQV
jgi:hypothetical protein